MSWSRSLESWWLADRMRFPLWGEAAVQMSDFSGLSGAIRRALRAALTPRQVWEGVGDGRRRVPSFELNVAQAVWGQHDIDWLAPFRGRLADDAEFGAATCSRGRPSGEGGQAQRTAIVGERVEKSVGGGVMGLSHRAPYRGNGREHHKKVQFCLLCLLMQ